MEVCELKEKFNKKVMDFRMCVTRACRVEKDKVVENVYRKVIELS